MDALLEMARITEERGLILPLIVLEEGFMLTIWRPLVDTIHDAEHDNIHDLFEPYSNQLSK